MHVSLQRLRVGYTTVLCRVDSFESSASRVRIAGRNGVGKTTFLLGLGGVRSMLKGTILIDGRAASKRRRSAISNVMSDTVALPCATVGEVVRFLAAIARPPTDIERQADTLGLRQVFAESCTRISSGTQQKLRFLAAIARQPAWLLLDEPVEHLDAESRSNVIQQICDYPGTVWFTDHTGLLPFEESLSLVRHPSS